MKIRLSEDEVYEIKMPEEIGMNDFSAIVAKFNFLMKNFSKFNIGNEKDEDELVLNENEVKVAATKIKKYSKSRWLRLRNDRELFINLLKMHYLHTAEEFYDFCKKNNIEFKKVDIPTTQMLRLRELHNAKPQEVGLIKWPSKTDPVQNLIIVAAENLQGDEYE
jgi:hypothetical protein